MYWLSFDVSAVSGTREWSSGKAQRILKCNVLPLNISNWHKMIKSKVTKSTEYQYEQYDALNEKYYQGNHGSFILYVQTKTKKN